MALKKGSVENDNFTIFCWGSGVRCIVWGVADNGDNGDDSARMPVFLTPYSNASRRYDDDLFQLATNLNRLVKDTHEKRKDRTTKLGFLVLEQGILPVWKRELAEGDDPTNYVPREKLVDLDGKTDAEIARVLEFEMYRTGSTA